ncbi:hypothetical protein EGI16_03575 [Chryseobacterium sp. G0240]|uniref:hypothetical protein n=1 Tax=Chryseobacterium sp. G0240 TaxID=2487066 RepID=UPI000F45B668|nr:hypothetical protein [Chryseobacterium sp. G0240]ROI05479.1 hypothetical protein EGI16_03575 [Chryseobacterium sp. G0240]
MENSRQTDKTPPIRPAGFDWLKRLDPTNKIVIEYEKAILQYNKNFIDSDNDSIEAYRKTIGNKPEELNIGKIDLNDLYSNFLHLYPSFNPKKEPFDETVNNGEGRKFARAMLLYYLGHPRFLKCELINRDITEPSMDKGVLVMGLWGNGKTSIIKTINYLFSRPLNKPLLVKNKEEEYYPLALWKRNFNYYDANLVVDDYEWRNGLEKAEFWKKHVSGKNNTYDDVLTERQVSNYGKFEIFKDILEKRNAKQLQTVVNCNYSTDPALLEKYKGKDGQPTKTRAEITLIEFGMRYGKRVYDRMHSDFTIIELKGKSLRK